MKTPWIILIIIFLCLLLCLLVCAITVGSTGIWALFKLNNTPITQSSPSVGLNPTNTPVVIRPTKTLEPTYNTTPEDPAATIDAPEPTALPIISSSAPADTLETLENTIVPINDPLEAGDQRSFWVTNTDNNQNFQVEASLGYLTDHVYFWVEDGVQFNQNNLKNLVETFEEDIYPTNREFFGSEWIPGVDADPHMHILFARGLGGSVAGYFSTVDEYLPVVREYSNGHEMFFLSADHVSLNEEFAYAVLAHEFQHMIHWYQDRNEETWMNEGFADLAMFLNGYSIGGADRSYVLDPDIQLNDWPTEPTNRSAHYGASFLFMTYFLDRLGDEATKAVVAEPANGMVSIDLVLAELGINDSLTGEALGADDIFADWVLASYLQDSDISDGRYTYHNYASAPAPSETETISSCTQELITRDVSQYGVDYIQLRCNGDQTLNFEGSLQVGVLPEDPYSGSYAYYSNKGDESDMTLTRTFDFTDQAGPLTLTYWTWYDLEVDYDYLYLTASVDGEDWQILITPSGTPDDPSGNSYGWAYNGASGAGPKWIQESVDISQFAGKELQLRFEYVTDAAVNGEGLLLDDVAIPEIDYFTDFEQDGGGWEAQGFVRIQNALPQTFRISLIRIGDGTTVETIDLSADNSADIFLDFDGDLREAILVVSGTTRFTRQNAAYQFSIQP